MIHWSNRYINIPYVNKGRDFSGADCWGLARLVYLHELNIELPSYGEVSADNLVKVSRKIEEQYEEWEEVQPDNVKPFDICVMRVAGKRLVCHVGIMIDKKRVLHVEKNINSAIVEIREPLIRERIVCFRRHKKLML